MYVNQTEYNLTEPQKRIWVTQHLYPDSSMFNIGGDIRIKGRIELRQLEQSICQFICQNSSFQIRIIIKDGLPLQYFHEKKYLSIPFVDFSDCNDPEHHFSLWAEKEIRTVFELYDSPLYQFYIYKIGENEYGYFIKLHHIIADGWSVQIMTEAIGDIYASCIDDSNKKIKGSDYRDFINSEKLYLNSDKYIENKKYWSDSMNTEAIGDTLNRDSVNLSGKRKTFQINEQDTRSIKKFCKVHNLSINAFFIAVYYVYSNVTTGRNQLIIGTPLLGRVGRSEKDIFGMFVNTVPFYHSIDDNETFINTVKTINNKLLKHYKNQRYPYNHFVKDLKMKKYEVGKIYDICVNYYGTTLKKEICGIPVYNTEFYNGEQEYSMQMIIRDWNNNFQIEFDYQIIAYTDEQIEEMFQCYYTLILEALSANENKLIKSMCLLNAAEKEKVLLHFNQHETLVEPWESVIEMFEVQATKHPNKVAVLWRDKELTYSELKSEMDRVAWSITQKSKKDSIIGVLTGHNHKTVISILGILKAGCAFLPIDEAYPSDRISYILKDAEAEILINTSNNCKVDNIDLPDVDVIPFDEIKVENNKITQHRKIKKNDLAYILYTSGTTKNPKGVMIEHESISNYILWGKNTYIQDNNEVFPLYSSFSFDLTMTSIFVPLAAGCQIIVYDNEGEEYVFNRLISDNSCTIIKLTPSHLSLLNKYNLNQSKVHTLIVGGEILKTHSVKELIKKFDKKVKIYNEYGPTEATVGCMIYLYDNDQTESVPIGCPIDNTKIYVLDKNMNPLPPNIAGKLFISGKGLMRGYLNQPELTAEKFVCTSFEKSRIYDSGDMAKFLNQNTIEYIGRFDTQVKVQGYRVSLVEIEHNILANETVQNVYVTMKSNNRGASHIYAYYISESTDENTLRQYLLSKMPSYSVPTFLIRMKKFPLTRNGKIDEEKLPAPNSSEALIRRKAVRHDAEDIVINVISDVLDVHGIDSSADFYHMGGDSIKAIEVSSRLHKKGFILRLKDILANPIIYEMCNYLKSAVTTQEIKTATSEAFPPTPIIRWFIANNEPYLNHYYINMLVELKKPVSVNTLEQIQKLLIGRYDSLRLNIDKKTNMLYYNDKCLNENINIKVYKFIGPSYNVPYEEIRELQPLLQKSIDINDGLLMQSCLVTQGEKLYWFILLHHLAVDGVSIRIMLRDIDILLQQYYNDQKYYLPNNTATFQEWAIKMDKRSFFPKYIETPKSNTETHIAEMYVEEDLVSSAIAYANKTYRIDTNELLFAILLYTLSSQGDIGKYLFEIENYGREMLINKIDITDTVGWFTHLFYMDIPFANSDDIHDYIMVVKSNFREALKKSYTENYTSSEKKKVIRYNYMGDFKKEYDNIIARPMIDNTNPLTCFMEFNLLFSDRKLYIHSRVQTDCMTGERLKKFLCDFKSNITYTAQYCKSKASTELLVSDCESKVITQEDIDQIFC